MEEWSLATSETFMAVTVYNWSPFTWISCETLAAINWRGKGKTSQPHWTEDERPKNPAASTHTKREGRCGWIELVALVAATELTHTHSSLSSRTFLPFSAAHACGTRSNSHQASSMCDEMKMKQPNTLCSRHLLFFASSDTRLNVFHRQWYSLNLCVSVCWGVKETCRSLIRIPSM